MTGKRVIMKTITYKWLCYFILFYFFGFVCSLGAAGTPSVLVCVN